MKKNFKQCKTKFLLFFLLALFAGGLSPAWADELTVYDGTATNANLPIYGYYADSKGTASEFIIPAADLADMKDKVIEQLMFYISSAASKKYGATFNVYLEEVEGENYDESSASQLTASKTLVYTGALDADGSTLVVPFDTEYTYKGGNLLIATEVTTAGSYANASFYGTTTTVNTGRCNKGSTTRFKFIPKTTFAYSAANPYKKPASISVGEIMTTTAVVSWTAGSGDSSETGWNLEYKKSSDENWTEVHGLGATPLSYAMSELEANTSYDVRVQAVYSGGESKFVATTFKTAKVATPATGFTDNFETDKGWELINGTVPNKWVRGTGTNNGGSYSLYISNDGANYNSSYGSSSLVYASKLFYFEAGDYTVSYDWLCNGESGYDLLRVGLAPEELEFSASTSYSNLSSTSTLPSGWTKWLDGGSPLYGSTTWATKSVDITIETAGNYQVVFGWRNDYSGGSYPAAIDNFKILGATPVLELSGDVVGTALAFGSVAETTNKTIRITNSGKVAMENITLTETADADNVFAYAELPKTTLAANEYMDVQVTFSGSSAKDYTGTFQVAADDCDPIDVTVTATYSNSAATMAVTIGEEAVGAKVAFGNVGKQATKTFTVTNDGDQTLNVTSITSSNTTDFTVTPSSLEVAGHSSETFTVTFVYPSENPVLDAEKTANITVTASNDGIEPVEFAVTGTRIELWSEDFSGNALPDGWETTSTTYWTFADGVAKGTYQSTNYYLTTPSLTVEEGASLSFDVCANTTYVTMTIEKQLNNGTWTSCKDISYSTDFGSIGTGVWKTFTIDGLDAGNYKFRFNARGFWLDNFQGFKRNLNDPKLGIYSDAECTAAVATSVAKDFGFATETQTATYYIKNDGTGTMTLSLGDAPAGLTQALDKTSVAAGEHATLTITMPVANKGYNGGNVVVTATDLGTFTVAVSGVIVDEDKLNLNFASDNIPATWTANSWSKNANGYLQTNASSNLETSKLTATAGEEIVIVAKQAYSSSNYTFGVNYKKVGAAEWSTLIASSSLGNSNWVTLHASIAEAGDYLFQFVGYYAQIQRIYGLSVPQEPVMVVYDGEELAAATYNFGNVSDEADATWTLTVKNEGKAELTGLAAALTGDDAEHYSVEVSATSVAVDGSTTITVTQLKDNIGAHSATLTISATGLDNKVITLSGNTYDHTKLFVDFENGNLPTGWTKGSYWSVSQVYGQDNHSLGHSSGSSYATSVVTTPLTVADKEELTFGASRYYSSSAPTLKVRYTADGGLTWSDYIDFSDEITSSYSGNYFKELTLNGVPTGTVVLEFYGSYVRLDNIYGFTATTAPMIALKENSIAVENESTKEFGTLTAEGTATYTLTNNGNAEMVSTVAMKGDASVVISGEGEGVTIDGNNVTLAAGKSATITLTMPYEAPFGEKDGAMTIITDGWVGDFIVNYTATTVDPTALYVNFDDNTKPEGWYQETSGWTFTLGTAHVYTGVTRTLITEQYGAEDGKNVLSFDAKLYYGTTATELKVYTSADRKSWTLAKTVTLTEEIQAVALDALSDGNYYVKFESTNASIDNLAGLKKLTAPAHDLYVSATTFPATTLVPNAVAGVNATATVHSLRANETGVYAKLFFDEDVIATAEAKAISLDGSATFTLTANVPETEKTYAAKIVVYYSDNSVAFETLTTNVEVAHTRTLAITEFTRTDGDGALDANASNQISPSFSVTVENTGSTSGTPVVKIYQGETIVATATADAAVAPEGTKTIELTATNMSAGEGGVLEFTAKAFWTAEGEALATSASNVSINVNAAAPLFVLYQDATPVGNGDDVEFGLVKTGEIPTYSYTIRNEGTANMELVSIVAPTGFTATPAITDDNKNIAVNGTLAITVTMQAEQGKKSGNLVITYKVDAMTNNTFTLALSGRSIAADTWTEDFEGDSIPENWTNNNGWTVAEYDDNHYATKTGWDAMSIMTPRLAATEGEELTFDVLSVGNIFSYAYSTDKANWSDEVVVNAAGEQTFTAPADGNYYLRFTTRNGRLDNLVGFRLNSLNLILDEASTNSFAAANYDKITLNRTFIAGWNTVCLPFAFIQESDIEEFFGEGAKVYYLSSHNGTEFFFDRASGMEAGYPYLVYVPEAITEPKVMHNVDIPNTATEAHYRDHTSNGSTIYFRGTYSPITAGGWTKDNAKDKIYVLTPEAKIAKAGASATSKGFRGYFDTPATMEVKGIVFDDIETGIISIENGELTIDNGAIYNLAGQRINRAQKGVNIVNGKKMLVK